MALLQALLAFVARSTGKIFSTLFGWSVKALFGYTTERETPYLSALVAAAALWPVLVVGTLAPRVAAVVLAFVALPRSVPELWLRTVWIVLALAVPIVAGIVLAQRGKQRTAPWRRALSGFRITLGIALAFLVVLVTVPFFKVVAALRRRSSEVVPLVIEEGDYDAVCKVLFSTLRRHGFALEERRPSLASRLPTRILRLVGGEAFRASLPDRVVAWHTPALDIVVQPNGATLSGTGSTAARAHGLVSEALIGSPALQTTDPAAQEIERRIKKVWGVHESDRRDAASAGDLDAIVDSVLRLEAPYDDWQNVHRQALQLAREVEGRRQLLSRQRPNFLQKMAGRR